jgi:hypothetical protein
MSSYMAQDRRNSSGSKIAIQRECEASLDEFDRIRGAYIRYTPVIRGGQGLTY